MLHAELLTKASTCLWSPFPIYLSYPLVLALNFLLAETISLLPLSTTALQGPNQDFWQRCYSNCIQNLAAKNTQTNPVTKRKGWIWPNRERACNQQQCLGTGQLLLVLVTVFQQEKDLKQWWCHSPFFSFGNNPVAQVKLMPGMPGTGNSWLQEEHMCAKSHLHHSISFPLAIAEMCFLMWLTGLVS